VSVALFSAEDFGGRPLSP